jgi:glucuronate isomerase
MQIRVDALAKLIKDKIKERSQTESNPHQFMAQMIARLAQIDNEDGLIALGGELGILNSVVRNGESKCQS